MRNFQVEPITKQEKIDWLNAIYNENRTAKDDEGQFKSMMAYSLLTQNVMVTERQTVLKLG